MSVSSDYNSSTPDHSVGVNYKLRSATGTSKETCKRINFSVMRRASEKLPACNYTGILVGASPPQDGHYWILLMTEKNSWHKLLLLHLSVSLLSILN